MKDQSEKRKQLDGFSYCELIFYSFYYLLVENNFRLWPYSFDRMLTQVVVMLL